LDPQARLETAGRQDGAALFRLSGSLDFGSVPAVYRAGLEQFGTDGDIVLDLAGVTRANSAGLALLLEWQRLARQGGRALRLRNLPASLRNIAMVSELVELLPAEDGAR
jgi:phospholipid transport system transporter-binding protein